MESNRLLSAPGPIVKAQRPPSQRVVGACLLKKRSNRGEYTRYLSIPGAFSKYPCARINVGGYATAKAAKCSCEASQFVGASSTAKVVSMIAYTY